MAEENNKGFWQDLWRESIKAMVLGWDLAVPIFAGVLIGYFLDKYLGTVYIFTIGLLVAGIAVGYYNVARFIRRLDRIDSQRESEKVKGENGQEKTKSNGKENF